MGVIESARKRTFIAMALLAIVLFASAGTLQWLPGWLFLAVLALSMTLPLYGPLRFDEGLLQERMSRKPDAKRWDRSFVLLVEVFTLAEVIVPGLDYRFGWSPPLPGWTMWAGFAGVALGTAGITWAMFTNRFFSTVVRIQRDRGHRVVSNGPYRWVRHPGYAFWMVQGLSAPLLFQSLWTYVPLGSLAVTMVVRTALEDRTLRHELEGYAEYASRVRFRLIPGIW